MMRNVTLHDELARILEARGNRWQSTRDLAVEVNRRGLYLKRDGSPVLSGQIHLRTRSGGHYQHLFERDGKLVRLRRPDPTAPEVALQAVAEPDKSVLANLIELYRHDLSEFRGYEISAHGTFGYRFLDLYFLEPEREARFVRQDGRLVGFVLTRLVEAHREVAEFFVLRCASPGRHRSGGGQRDVRTTPRRMGGRLRPQQRRGSFVLD